MCRKVNSGSDGLCIKGSHYNTYGAFHTDLQGWDVGWTLDCVNQPYTRGLTQKKKNPGQNPDKNRGVNPGKNLGDSTRGFSTESFPKL